MRRMRRAAQRIVARQELARDDRVVRKVQGRVAVGQLLEPMQGSLLVVNVPGDEEVARQGRLVELWQK